MVAEGLTNEEIATRLGISSETVETHRFDLMQKLDLHTQADLIRFALAKRHQSHGRLAADKHGLGTDYVRKRWIAQYVCGFEYWAGFWIKTRY